MKKIEDFIDCIFEEKENWSLRYKDDDSSPELSYNKDNVTVYIYKYSKYVKYKNFWGKYLKIGELHTFYDVTIHVESDHINYSVKNIYSFRDKVYKKIQDIKFKKSLDKLRLQKKLINNLEC